jgi:hypothetical protein
MTTDFDPAAFGEAWQRFIEHINAHIPPPAPPAPLLVDKLLAFLGAEPTSLVIHKEQLLERDLPNLQRAIDHFLAGPDRYAEQVGYLAEHEQPGMGLAALLARQRWQNITEGPVQYRWIELAGGEQLQCMDRGLYLINDHGVRLVAAVRKGEYYNTDVALEVLCLENERAEAFLSELRSLMQTRNVYRGQVISLGAKGPEDIRFHTLPPVTRADIILPEALLQTIERSTLGFDAHAPALRAAGRHLKRGLLFHGPPGNGKTLTIMYLLAAMRAEGRGRTALLLTGRVQGLIAQSCRLARLLAPSVVVLEDVDLIAQERESNTETGPLLFELLNEMDGLSEDTDVIFILSTNRPDRLEPALAARPGRIDQAVEFPLPNAEGRERLFHRYGQGLKLKAGDVAGMVRRTEGTSAAFIRELLRKAALLAADERATSAETIAPEVSDRHLRAALHAIVVEGGDLTRRLLGVAPGSLADTP